MKKTDPPVVVEEILNRPNQSVWEAITDPGQMVQWFFKEIESFMPFPGFKTQFTVDAGERQFVHLWKITEVVPNIRIVYNWRYQGYSGDSFVHFELFDAGQDKTRVRVTHRVIKDFPDHIPEFKRSSCVTGWEYFIKDRLKHYLEKNN